MAKHNIKSESLAFQLVSHGRGVASIRQAGRPECVAMTCAATVWTGCATVWAGCANVCTIMCSVEWCMLHLAMNIHHVWFNIHIYFTFFSLSFSFQFTNCDRILVFRLCPVLPWSQCVVAVWSCPGEIKWKHLTTHLRRNYLILHVNRWIFKTF